MSGTKTPIYGPDVRHVTIPQYEGLGIQDIANFVNTRANVLPFLPDGKELSKTPKQWIGNVCASVLFIVLQGSGVHMLKAGSKRRRTKA